MIAVHLLTREEVRDKLSQFGCKLIEEVENPDDDYYSASYWRTSWGFHFFVPQVGDDRATPEHKLWEIMAELSELAEQEPE